MAGRVRLQKGEGALAHVLWQHRALAPAATPAPPCARPFVHMRACLPAPASPLPPPPAGQKQWVGVNEWQGLPAIRVALGVRGSELTEWVLDRMTR